MRLTSGVGEQEQMDKRTRGAPEVKAWGESEVRGRLLLATAMDRAKGDGSQRRKVLKWSKVAV